MATAQAMVNFRIDRDLKADMEQVCKEMGLTLTAAFTMFAARVTRDRKIPFEVEGDPFYSKENMDELARRIADAKAGRNMHYHDIIEV